MFFVQSSLTTLEKKNSDLESELLRVRKDSNEMIEKLREFEEKCSKLQQTVKRYYFIKWSLSLEGYS